MTDIKKSNRIQYLDALRGFTMILVVLNHVAAEYFGVSYNPNNFHYYIAEFRMPLFFFVSGFVLYKKDFVWNIKNSLSFFKKKIFVQIISPFIFFCVYIYLKDISFIDSITDKGKAGYWFTFTLFMYFIIYAGIQYIFQNTKIQKLQYIIPIYFIIGVFFYFNGVTQILLRTNTPETITGFLGTANLMYFIFFLIGTLARKYFEKFENILDKRYTMFCILLSFFALNIFIDLTALPKIENKILNFILSLSGILIIFSIFRKNKTLFESNDAFPKLLKFIGRRTLDIYLIHFFFLYKGFADLFPFFRENQFPLIEICCSLLVTTLVISASLAVSYILRLSPYLAHYLFGAKKL
jgi:fucose 4-O-acetylase-like acetyltransferase